jgi:hypothetical protein
MSVASRTDVSNRRAPGRAAKSAPISFAIYQTSGRAMNSFWSKRRCRTPRVALQRRAAAREVDLAGTGLALLYQLAVFPRSSRPTSRTFVLNRLDRVELVADHLRRTGARHDKGAADMAVLHQPLAVFGAERCAQRSGVPANPVPASPRRRLDPVFFQASAGVLACAGDL